MLLKTHFLVNLSFISWFTHFCRKILLSRFTHFFRKIFWTGEQTLQTFSLFWMYAHIFMFCHLLLHQGYNSLTKPIYLILPPSLVHLSFWNLAKVYVPSEQGMIWDSIPCRRRSDTGLRPIIGLARVFSYKWEHRDRKFTRKLFRPKI